MSSIFLTPPSFPHMGRFLVLSFGNFDQFLTPPPFPIAEVFNGRPLKISSYFRLLVEKQDHKIKFVMPKTSELLMENVMGRVSKIGLVLALFSWVFSCLVLEYRFIFHLEYHMLMTILQEITGMYFFRLWSFMYRKQNYLNKNKKINLSFFTKFYFHSPIK